MAYCHAMAQKSDSRDLDKVIVRLPNGMRDRIKLAADANNRSMNAEIVAALEDKFPEDFHLSSIAHALLSLKLALYDDHQDKESLRKWIEEAEEDLDAYRRQMIRGDRGAPF